jgi:hypothetical protein
VNSGTRAQLPPQTRQFRHVIPQALEQHTSGNGRTGLVWDWHDFAVHQQLADHFPSALVLPQSLAADILALYEPSVSKQGSK